MGKPLLFSAFVMNTASHILHGFWRQPDGRQGEFNALDLWIDLKKELVQHDPVSSKHPRANGRPGSINAFSRKQYLVSPYYNSIGAASLNWHLGDISCNISPQT